MELNVFISWSGSRGGKLARALHEFLPDVAQNAKPWLSSEDIEKGRRFGVDIAGALDTSKIGIICLTPESLDSRWVLFEAGALAKTVSTAFVCPYLLGLQHRDVKPPLADFQMTKADSEDTLKLMQTLNRALGEQVDAERLRRTFDRCWPGLDSKLQLLLREQPAAKPPAREQGDILEEVLVHMRSIERRLEEVPAMRAPSLDGPDPRDVLAEINALEQTYSHLLRVESAISRRIEDAQKREAEAKTDEDRNRAALQLEVLFEQLQPITDEMVELNKRIDLLPGRKWLVEQIQKAQSVPGH